MNSYRITETECPEEYAYNVKAKNLTDVRHWIINHLDTSLEYTITPA